MTYPPLTQDSDLSSFPGAPYADAVIRAAEASIRRDANWHIAPQVTEAMEVECTDPWRLVLQSLRVVSVASVVGDDSVAVTGYKVHKHGSYLTPPDRSWWTVGMIYTVTLTHGYDSAPDLLPVVASRCQRQMADQSLTQRSETVGQRTSSESYNVGRMTEELAAQLGSPLRRYIITAIG